MQKKTLDKREVINEVRTLTFKDRLLEQCSQRNDELATTVARRVSSILCLVAAEARYHQTCYAKFLSNLPSTRKRGRPQDEDISTAIQKLCEYSDNSDNNLLFPSYCAR